MRNFFNRLKSRLDTAEERIKEFEDMSVEMIKIETKNRKRVMKEKQKRAVKGCGTKSVSLTCT